MQSFGRYPGELSWLAGPGKWATCAEPCPGVSEAWSLLKMAPLLPASLHIFPPFHTSCFSQLSLSLTLLQLFTKFPWHLSLAKIYNIFHFQNMDQITINFLPACLFFVNYIFSTILMQLRHLFWWWWCAFRWRLRLKKTITYYFFSC